MSRPPSASPRARVALAVLCVLAVAGAAVYLTRSGSDDDVDTVPATIPQLHDVALTIYGDSWTVPAAWHSPGRHWSEQLVSRVGSVTDHGVGNTTMEDAANLAGGGSAAAWTDPDEPSCVLVMSVLNTARYPDDRAARRAASEASMRAAATSIAGMVLGDHYSEERLDLTTFLGDGWTPVANPDVAGGTIQGSSTGTVRFVVPDGYSDRQMWMATLIGPARSTFRVSRDGTELETVETPIPDATETGYTKYLLPIGKVSTGDEITVTGIAGGFWYDGMHIDSGANHVVFATEPSHLPTIPPSPFDNEANFDAHDEVIRDVVDEINQLVPDGASLVDLDAAPGWDDDTMTAADQVHPNDKGQAWILGVMVRDLRANVPRTARLSP